MTLRPAYDITVARLMRDHPRRYRALERLVAGPLHTGATTTSTVVWERQSLPDFEARRLRYVADDYDLV